ncbi:MAG TPA: lantibiotic dehydratase, partial [Pyrinomonadaceae bacterium]|nr:lantibiotic dehydratase [Pyrinomonadaceae bacterium]
MTEICRSEPAAVSSQSSIRFKPYVLWRSGMLAFADLSSLVPQATWELLDRSAKGRESRLELADQLADRLYVIIPRLAPDERRGLLQLRRDLHNDRLPQTAALTLLENKLDDSGRQILDQWRQSRLADEELRTTATDRLVVDLETARTRLKEVATSEYFLRGVQLSGSNLYRDVRSYLNREQPAARPFSKKLRQTENTIIRYAYRMSLRTSPFGCFTEIGAQPWLHAASTENSGERRHVVTLSRGLLTWMVYELRRIEGSEQFLMLRLNNTLQRVDNQFEAFTRGMDGGSNAYWGESFIKVQGIGPVALIIQTLAGGPQLKSEVVNRFVERKIPADKALTFIDGVIKAGVCHQDLALPDQVTSFAGEVAARLRTVSTEPAARCADVFERLQQIETEIAQADAEHREELLEELMAQVDRFSEICGVPPPPVVSRSFVFEDVAAPQHTARSFYPEILEKNTDHFSRLLRLLPVFDDAAYERLGLYHWFATRFGERGHCEDLLALYGEFSEQSDADISAIMQATNDPHAQQCRSLEREILKRLDRAVEEAGDGPTLQLDPRCVDELAASVSDVLRPWEEAAF